MALDIVFTKFTEVFASIFIHNLYTWSFNFIFFAIKWYAKKKCHFILSFDNSVYFGTKTEYFGVLTHNFQSNYGLAAVFSIYILLTRILGVGFGNKIYKYFINGLCLAHL